MRAAFRPYLLLAAFVVAAPAVCWGQAIEVEDADGKAPAEAPAEPVPTAPTTVKVPLVLDPHLELVDPRMYRLKIVHRIEAVEGDCDNVVVVGPSPMDWPEQRLRLISEKTTDGVKLSEQVFRGQAAMLKMQVASIPKGGAAFVERLYEVTRYRTQFKLPAEELKHAKRAPSEMRDQLAGPAPGLDLKHPKMVELHQSLVDSKLPAWDQIKSYWKWTRDNVKFENGDYRGAMFAIEQRCGDCEEMSALFVSLCRLSNIPARTVWVEGHDYPEFYMVDGKGQGHWVPCQVVGPPWFGEIMEYRPIFQKGDRFYDPFHKQYVRYVPHTVRSNGTKPKLVIKHDIIADSDINGPSYNNPK
jgi:hypothetical protein